MFSVTSRMTPLYSDKIHLSAGSSPAGIAAVSASCISSMFIMIKREAFQTLFAKFLEFSTFWSE